MLGKLRNRNTDVKSNRVVVAETDCFVLERWDSSADFSRVVVEFLGRTDFVRFHPQAWREIDTREAMEQWCERQSTISDKERRSIALVVIHKATKRIPSRRVGIVGIFAAAAQTQDLDDVEPPIPCVHEFGFIVERAMFAPTPTHRHPLLQVCSILLGLAFDELGWSLLESYAYSREAGDMLLEAGFLRSQCSEAATERMTFHLKRRDYILRDVSHSSHWKQSIFLEICTRNRRERNPFRSIFSAHNATLSRLLRSTSRVREVEAQITETIQQATDLEQALREKTALLTSFQQNVEQVAKSRSGGRSRSRTGPSLSHTLSPSSSRSLSPNHKQSPVSDPSEKLMDDKKALRKLENLGF